MEYEAGVRFGNDVFVRFNYISEDDVVEVTVITADATKTGSANVNSKGE